MKMLVGETLSGESVEIDGKHFVDCTLIDCVLDYSGFPYIMERTSLRGCRYLFYGQARGTVHFLQDVGLLGSASTDWGEVSSTLN